MRSMRALGLALLLVAWPAMAVAECGWILWKEQPENSGQWDIVRAYTSQPECVNSAEAQWSRTPPDPSRKLRDLRTGRLEPTRYECLPDTVDPRGPKR